MGWPEQYNGKHCFAILVGIQCSTDFIYTPARVWIKDTGQSFKDQYFHEGVSQHAYNNNNVEILTQYCSSSCRTTTKKKNTVVGSLLLATTLHRTLRRFYANNCFISYYQKCPRPALIFYELGCRCQTKDTNYFKLLTALYSGYCM